MMSLQRIVRSLVLQGIITIIKKSLELELLVAVEILVKELKGSRYCHLFLPRLRGRVLVKLHQPTLRTSVPIYAIQNSEWHCNFYEQSCRLPPSTRLFRPVDIIKQLRFLKIILDLLYALGRQVGYRAFTADGQFQSPVLYRISLCDVCLQTGKCNPLC